MEEILITQDVSNGYDETWSEWFTCPKCKGEIQARSKFCPNCGVKLKWDKNALTDNVFFDR